MKTLEQFIEEVKQSYVHVCGAGCRKAGAYPIHTGGHYDKVEHIPATLMPQIIKKAKILFNAQETE